MREDFCSQLAAIKDMANSLFAVHYCDPVDPSWEKAFVKYRLKFKMRFNRKYNYKRALCKDPKLM
jgi:hypothetical protein